MSDDESPYAPFDEAHTIGRDLRGELGPARTSVVLMTGVTPGQLRDAGIRVGDTVLWEFAPGVWHTGEIVTEVPVVSIVVRWREGDTKHVRVRKARKQGE